MIAILLFIFGCICLVIGSEEVWERMDLDVEITRETVFAFYACLFFLLSVVAGTMYFVYFSFSL